MRARDPDVSGAVERDGVPIGFEVFGQGPVTVLLMPTFPVVDSRMWKAQVPYLARHFRVITFDPRGNGVSGRPTGAEAYADGQYAADALAVLDATGTDAAFLVALCSGVPRAALVADRAPDRVRGLVAIAPETPCGRPEVTSIEPVHHPRWRGHYVDWVDHHSEQLLAEPHSTRILDDLVAWGLATDAEVLTASMDAPWEMEDPAREAEVLAGLRCPVLVVHGTEDRCQPVARGRALAEVTGGQLIEMAGAGHLPQARHPVLVNLAIRDFVERHAST